MVVFERVGLESLLFDVPLVCKSWYKATHNPQCWTNLDFSTILFKSAMLRFSQPMMKPSDFMINFFKIAVNRSCRSATQLALPVGCTPEALRYVSQEFPNLRVLDVGTELWDYGNWDEKILDRVDVNLLHLKCVELLNRDFPKFIAKWKYLEHLSLLSIPRDSFKEILRQISLSCKNFSGLSTTGTVGTEEALAIATSLQKIRYLKLSGSFLPKNSLKVILEGCKNLVLLDARNCCGFEEDDEDILKMASHIKTFFFEGSKSFFFDPSKSYYIDHFLYQAMINSPFDV
ncbi:F-box protein SKIP19-like [Macadamia integrifolia]|uniref:F-box protein SKIP19-like n=1 Tax=Macadamia integrifolia TaxID=60698 RepID=UPI001C4EE1F4|nr:F-box protein SKIP19-like [Macadamia integrifolia]